MTFRFSKASLARLATVDPKLQAVATRALEISCVDFVVVQGNRTLDEQKRLYGKGRTAAQCKAKGVPVSYAKPNEAKVTWTLNSNHIGGRAIDVAPYVDGGIQWDDSGKRGLWPKIAAAFKQAASELGVKITWGGDWKGTVDRPHFELSR
ncbi:endolysin [Pseudoxanthomonas phage PW916]|nr:endolysin [Pseudoxanthomonas phage PW916]